MESLSMEISRVRLAEPLACGMTGCATPTTSGLLEPDPQTRGLWRLLPVCATCAALLRGRPSARRQRDTPPRQP